MEDSKRAFLATLLLQQPLLLLPTLVLPLPPLLEDLSRKCTITTTEEAAEG